MVLRGSKTPPPPSITEEELAPWYTLPTGTCGIPLEGPELARQAGQVLSPEHTVDHLVFLPLEKLGANNRATLRQGEMDLIEILASKL